MPREIPASTEAFIRQHIHSVEQLEILLLLQSHPDQSWTPEAVDERIRSNPESVARHLAALVGQGLAEAHPGDGRDQYRYAPSTPALARDVADLAALYKERRVTVVELIFAEPPSPIQGFADSFRIRKEDKNG